MARRIEDDTPAPISATKTGELTVRVKDIKDVLSDCNTKLVGDLTVLNPGPLNSYSARRSVYLEPIEPPEIPILTDKEVDALNAAAYYKRYPTPQLAAKPLEFARKYNEILESLASKAVIPVADITPFTFLVSHLGSSMIRLGDIHLRTTLGSSKVTIITTTEFSLQDAGLKQQLERFTQPSTQEVESEIVGFLGIRLFPPGLGTIMYAYEKGYYMDGNVEEWKELTYRNRYTEPWSLSFEQLQDLAKGEKPYPEVKYTDKSIFEDMTSEEVREVLRGRESEREIWRFTIADYFRPYSGGDFGEDSYDPGKRRGRDPNTKHTHYGTGHTVWETDI